MWEGDVPREGKEKKGTKHRRSFVLKEFIVMKELVVRAQRNSIPE